LPFSTTAYMARTKAKRFASIIVMNLMMHSIRAYPVRVSIRIFASKLAMGVSFLALCSLCLSTNIESMLRKPSIVMNRNDRLPIIVLAIRSIYIHRYS
jgi:hypothetical protein